MDVNKLVGLDESDNDYGLISEDIFIDSGIYFENLYPNKAACYRIEIMHELMELKEKTGEIYDTIIFD